MTDKKIEYCKVEELEIGDKYRTLQEDDWQTVVSIQLCDSSDSMGSDWARLVTSDCHHPGHYRTKLVYVQRKPETLTVDKAKLAKIWQTVNLTRSNVTVCGPLYEPLRYADAALRGMLDGTDY